MINLTKLSAILLVFFIILTSDATAKERILPLAKPLVGKEVKAENEKKKAIYPQKKPLKKKIETTNQNDEVEKGDEELKKTDELVFIYPKKKPITYVDKEIKIVQKSSVLSKKDFKIAKAAFNSINKRKWSNALKLSKRAKDKTLYNLVNWLYLKQPSNGATFYDYQTFISSNPEYPRISRLKYLAEHKINFNTSSPRSILKWFGETSPLSDYGKIKLGEIHIQQGNIEKGSKLIKEGWIKAKLSKNNLRYIRKKYKNIITVEDNIKRADWHAWEGKHWDVQRMLRYLPKEETALYRARLLLMSKSYGVDTAISKVPNKYKNNIGLQYDRLKWRRRRGRLEGSLEILFQLPKNSAKLVRPDIWWKERGILTRSLIYKKKYVLAYKVASNHSLTEGPKYAEAEWLSGWVAITFLDDPNIALEHFKNFYKNVGYPISLARGSYWIGHTYEYIKNEQKSLEWFEKASQFPNTYYGQLGFIKINGDKSFSLNSQREVSDKYKKKFKKNSLIKTVTLLKELNETKHTKDFLKHLSLTNIEEGSEILAGNLAIEIGRYDFAIQIAKQASYEKRFFNNLNYPIIETPKIVNNKTMPKSELILSVIRQESEFDSKANSSVGAKGMMQVMTYTAKLVAKQAKMPYSKSRLKSDPEYNIKLGSYYLAGLLEQYEGSYPFALAAYNAGPKRVKYWNKINGNPQKRKIDYINWIELIKFKETRNYVQRVLENINVYRYMLKGKPIKIYNFFEDKKLY